MSGRDVFGCLCTFLDFGDDLRFSLCSSQYGALNAEHLQVSGLLPVTGRHRKLIIETGAGNTIARVSRSGAGLSLPQPRAVTVARGSGV